MSEDLQRFLKELEEIENHWGMYPAAVSGYNDERDYEQRDGYKNGWNACVMEYGTAIAEATFKAQEKWSDEELVFASDDGCFTKIKDDWYVVVSDTWYYACSDCEPIPKDKWGEVKKWYQDWGWAGLLYWVYLQRKHEPQVKTAWERFDVVRKWVESRESRKQ